MGGCLNALYTSCADDVVKLTAAELVGVFPQSIWRTKSQELKVNYNQCPFSEHLTILVRNFLLLFLFLVFIFNFLNFFIAFCFYFYLLLIDVGD